MELQIGKILRRRKLTQRWLAEAVDVSPGYMSSLVSNQKKPSAELIEKMAEALGIEPGALWLSTRAIPVAGRIGAGSQVELVDAYAKGEGLYKIACPSDLEAEKIVGVEVRGDSMLPIFASGDVILFTRDFVGVDDSVIGQVCVLETESGMAMLKLVHRGSEPGHFDLFSFNGDAQPVIYGERLKWAVRYRRHLKKEDVARL